MPDPLEALTIATAVGTGVMGGVYLAFSVMVMPALRRLPFADAIRVMQLVNIAAIRPIFLITFLGTAILAVALLIQQIVAGTTGSVVTIVGAALSLAGFVLTVSYNVPRNNRLAAIDPAASTAHDAWERFDREWSRANHLRAAVSVLGAVALLVRG